MQGIVQISFLTVGCFQKKRSDQKRTLDQFCGYERLLINFLNVIKQALLFACERQNVKQLFRQATWGHQSIFYAILSTGLFFIVFHYSYHTCYAWKLTKLIIFNELFIYSAVIQVAPGYWRTKFMKPCDYMCINATNYAQTDMYTPLNTHTCKVMKMTHHFCADNDINSSSNQYILVNSKHERPHEESMASIKIIRWIVSVIMIEGAIFILWCNAMKYPAIIVHSTKLNLMLIT